MTKNKKGKKYEIIIHEKKKMPIEEEKKYIIEKNITSRVTINGKFYLLSNWKKNKYQNK